MVYYSNMYSDAFAMQLTKYNHILRHLLALLANHNAKTFSWLLVVFQMKSLITNNLFMTSWSHQVQ